MSGTPEPHGRVFADLLVGNVVPYRALVEACDAYPGDFDIGLVTTVDGGVRLRRSATSRPTLTRLHRLAEFPEDRLRQR